MKIPIFGFPNNFDKNVSISIRSLYNEFHCNNFGDIVAYIDDNVGDIVADKSNQTVQRLSPTVLSLKFVTNINMGGEWY